MSAQVSDQTCLNELGNRFWSVRIRRGRTWTWNRYDGLVNVQALSAELDVPSGTQLRVWQPSIRLGTVLVDASTPRRSTLASWQPFPCAELADLHPECFDFVARSLPAVSSRKTAPPAEDPAYWLAGTTPSLARAALGIARTRRMTLPGAESALRAAGFADLPEAAVEVVVALAGEWHGNVSSLVETARLVLN